MHLTKLYGKHQGVGNGVVALDFPLKIGRISNKKNEIKTCMVTLNIITLEQIKYVPN